MGEEFTVWNGYVNAPSVLVDVRPEFLGREEVSESVD